MEVVKLKPAIKDYIWGGNKLRKWGKNSSLDVIAECWEFSLHKDGLSLIDGGKDDGKTLLEVAKKEDFGKKIESFPFFPFLIKLIDAKDNLSIQVHPNDEYALKNENSYGKTEMWYVLSAEPGSGLYIGFKEDESIEDVEIALRNGTLLERLNFFKVKPGDSFFIESGTIHAIGKGVTLMEIQQSSNLTYRLYDYGRKGKDGKPRELHIEKGLKVIDLHRFTKKKFPSNVIGKCKYFESNLGSSKIQELIASEDSFITFTVIKGEGKVNDMKCGKGDTFFIPSRKKASLIGEFEFIYSKM